MVPQELLGVCSAVLLDGFNALPWVGQLNGNGKQMEMNIMAVWSGT